MYSLIFNLFLTIILEFMVIYLFIRDRPGHAALYIVLINLFTLPLANYTYVNFLPNLVVIEALVILVEGLLIKLLWAVSYQKAVLISISANLLSAIVGMLIFGSV